MKTVKDRQILMAADFAGHPLKEAIKEYLEKKGWTVTAADKRQVAAYAADVAAKYPGRAVEAYVAAVVGNRAYALRRVK